MYWSGQVTFQSWPTLSSCFCCSSLKQKWHPSYRHWALWPWLPVKVWEVKLFLFLALEPVEVALCCRCTRYARYDLRQSHFHWVMLFQVGKSAWVESIVWGRLLASLEWCGLLLLPHVASKSFRMASPEVKSLRLLPAHLSYPSSNSSWILFCLQFPPYLQNA